jgi:hypothetical protein
VNQADTRPATVLMFATYALGALGFFLAGLADTAEDALGEVTVFAVGGVGVASFLRHAVFARGDAARMGWGREGGSNFQLEVGFANLAFGAVALLAHFGDWGVGAEAAITLAFGVYLLQAALLHLRGYLNRETRGAGRLGGLLASFAIGGGLIYLALNAAEAASLGPF